MLISWIYKDTQLYREDSYFRVMSKSTKMVEKQSGFLLLFVAVLFIFCNSLWDLAIKFCN